MSRISRSLSVLGAIVLCSFASAQTDSTASRVRTIEHRSAWIATIDEWSGVEKRALMDSAEGGAAEYFYISGELVVIRVQRYGETSRYYAQFEMLDGHLAKAIETMSYYKEPLNGKRPVEVVKEESLESYLFNNTIIKQNGGTASPAEESARLMDDHKDLMDHLHHKKK